MRILYILKHDPWGIGGGCFACRKYLELFTTLFADAEFDACICEEYLAHARVEDFPNVVFIPVKQRSKLGKVMTPVTGLLHRHYDASKLLMSQNHYDYCIFDENGIAGSLVKQAARHGIKTIVLNHNCQYEYSRDNMTSWLEKLLILPVVERCERVSYKHCDYNIFLTEEDKEQFAVRYGCSATKSVVGGCFYEKGYKEHSGNLLPLRKENIKMVISGTMGNVQNLDGINYFLDELLPLMPKSISVVLAGKKPPQSLIERVKDIPNIEIIPTPKDMDAVVSDCDIFLCPARLGGGMKLRVMDGFRNGLPVLAHSISARGYRTFEREGVMVEFESKEQFEECLKRMLDDIKREEVTREKVLGVSEKLFSFESALQKISSIIRS